MHGLHFCTGQLIKRESSIKAFLRCCVLLGFELVHTLQNAMKGMDADLLLSDQLLRCQALIIEWPGLKRTTMLIQFQPPAMCRVANQQPRLPRATSSLALNACRDGASTASLGNLFQCSEEQWRKS